MDCPQYQSQFNSYLDGDLSSTERQTLQSHLRECLLCYRKWSSLQQTQELLRQLPALNPPEHLSAVVMARLKERGFRQSLWSLPSLPRWLPLGVGFAAVILISLTLWQVLPSPYSWQSFLSDSKRSLLTTDGDSEDPARRITAPRQRNSGQSTPVMVLRVKDFSRADRELETMLRSFDRPKPLERSSNRPLDSGSARLIDVQVSGQRFPHLLRELDKIGHLDHSEVQKHGLANSKQKKSISIRIVVISNGSDVQIRRLRE